MYLNIIKMIIEWQFMIKSNNDTNKNSRYTHNFNHPHSQQTTHLKCFKNDLLRSIIFVDDDNNWPDIGFSTAFTKTICADSS